MSGLKSLLLALGTISVVIVSYIWMADISAKRRVYEITENLLKTDSAFLRVDLLSLVTEYEKYTTTSDFLKGGRVFDRSWRLEVSFGEGLDTLKELKTPGISTIGLLTYQSNFDLNLSGRIYHLVFLFEDRAGTKILWLFCIFILCIFLLFYWIQRRSLKNFIKSTFISIETYAHDLGGFVHPMMTLINEAKSGCIDPRKIEYTERSLGYINSVRKEMLSARSDTLLDVKILDLKDIFERYFQDRLSKSPDISLTVDYRHQNSLQGDEFKISRIISNLVNNAICYCSGIVVISTRDSLIPKAKSSAILIEISNNGDGVPKHVIKNIFSPFVSYKGSSGLGLYIVRSFVHLHGGTIRVDSHSGMTTFRVLLPAKPKQVAASSIPDNRVSVAVIDDEGYFLDLVGNLVDDSHFILSRFSNIDAFYEALIEQKHYSIVIVDRFGPGFDAVEDKFPFHCRKNFGFTGKIVLYSSSVNEFVDGFDLCISKSEFDNQKKLTNFLNKVKNGTLNFANVDHSMLHCHG